MQSIRPPKSRSRARKAMLGLAITFVVAVVGLYAFKIGPFAPSSTTSGQTGSTSKPDSTPVSDVGTPAITDPGSNSVKNPQKTDDPAQSSDKGVQITSATVSGESLRVRTFIPMVTSSGDCNLTMTKTGSASYTASAGVQPLASSSTCKGFDVPLSSLSSGTWTATVTYTHAGVVSHASKKVTINA